MTTHANFLIDEAAATLPVPEGELRAWASRQRVFVSSLIDSMGHERAAAREAIEWIGATPVMFEEELGAQDQNAEQAYLAGVRSSGIYVGLFGERYGVRLASGYSATEMEFREAQQCGSRLCVFVNGVNGTTMDGAQRDLVGSVRNAYTTSTWSTPDDLHGRIVRRLTDLAAEELEPWVRVGDVLFRARKIRDNGAEATVTATIRNPAIISELSGYRDRGNPTLSYVAPGVAHAVQLTGLTSETTSTAGREITLSLRKGSGHGPASMRMSLTSNGQHWSADELAEATLSDALFLTSSAPSWHGMDSADPLAALRGRNLAGQVLRPAARLLLEEHLLRSGNAGTVIDFILGPEQADRRYLRISWTPVRQYSNEPPAGLRKVAGYISGL